MTSTVEPLTLPPSGLLPPKLAARLLSVSIRTLEEWRRKSYGPEYIRAGRSIRYRLADIEVWVERQKKIAHFRAA